MPVVTSAGYFDFNIMVILMMIMTSMRMMRMMRRQLMSPPNHLRLIIINLLNHSNYCGLIN